MAFDLLSLEPSVIDRSLSGKTLLLAGPPKIGKSEFCAQSPDTLILDFENGYNAHPGVYKYTITKWADVKQILRELRKVQVQQKFKNVVFDTLNEAWELSTNFICNQNGTQKIEDIPYGRGYRERDAEFAKVLREIITLGYGLIVTCHTKESIVGTRNNVDIKAIEPDLDKRCVPIVNGLVDVMGMITREWDADGNCNRWLITRSTPTIEAGSRWHLPDKIPFGYSYMEEAIVKAIDEKERNGAKVVDCVEKNKNDILVFDDVVKEARTLWEQLVSIDASNADRILKKIEIIFGRKMKLSEATEDQVDLLQLVVIEMRDML